MVENASGSSLEGENGDRIRDDTGETGELEERVEERRGDFLAAKVLLGALRFGSGGLTDFEELGEFISGGAGLAPESEKIHATRFLSCGGQQVRLLCFLPSLFFFYSPSNYFFSSCREIILRSSAVSDLKTPSKSGKEVSPSLTLMVRALRSSSRYSTQL